LALFLGYWLGRDLLRTPTGFPETMPAHGNRLKASAGDETITYSEESGSGRTADDPASAPEGEPGVPASRRREWWQPEPDSR
ncbi:MAG: hypothetical protein M3Y45_02330, partial [Actinomycetota bacterium]|nr:hypothetical protein [Actinomycetota bacterium]